MKRILIFLCLMCSLKALPEWNILIYMNGMEELHSAAIQNITHAMEGFIQTNSHVRIYLQVHSDSETNIAYRYHFSHKALIFEETITLTQNPILDITESAQWAFKKPATYHGLVFWNHGFGILDPTWTQLGIEKKFDWASEPDRSPIRSTHYQHHAHHHRGIFLDSIAKTYMNNDQMVQTLASIKQQVLHGKILDFLGTDTCGMAMLEVAWQIKEYAHYLIGAQNCALKDGWPYKEIIHHLSSTYHTPAQTIHMIIDEYKKYYQKIDATTYTQSVMDLSKIASVKKALDEISSHIVSSYSSEIIKEKIYTARQNCPVFCIHPTYTDLYTFYVQLASLFQDDKELLKRVEHGKNTIKKAVTAYTSGADMQNALGISIYFPYKHIDSSYRKTLFAHQSSWISFLQNYVS